MAKTRPGVSAPKLKAGKKDPHSYTIRGTNKIVRVGDCVLMRPSDIGKPPYVARVEKIESDNRNNFKVRVRWYYRPEESLGGRRQFHGAKELFLSDHYDVQSAQTVEDLNIKLLPEPLHLIELLCTANVRCPTILMILWFNVRVARIGIILLV